LAILYRIAGSELPIISRSHKVPDTAAGENRMRYQKLQLTAGPGLPGRIMMLKEEERMDQDCRFGSLCRAISRNLKPTASVFLCCTFRERRKESANDINISILSYI